MDDRTVIMGFAALCGLAIVLRLMAGWIDRARIRRYVETRGGKVALIRWSPFGIGWMGNRGQRIYRLAYEDSTGNAHSAYCKTSLLSGIYFTEDIVTRYRVVDVPRDKCPYCGYDLTGNVSGICTECGKPTPERLYGSSSQGEVEGAIRGAKCNKPIDAGKST